MCPAVKLGRPGVFRRLRPRPRARRDSRCTQASRAARRCRQRRGGSPGIAADADGDRLHQPEHLRVGIDLDDLRVLRPVVDAVLRQRAERPEPRAERQHDVGLRDELHRGLGALIAERAARKRMRRRETSRCADSCCHRRLQQIRRARWPRRAPSPMTTPPPRDDHRETAPRRGAPPPHRGSARRRRRARRGIGRGISHSMSP